MEEILLVWSFSQSIEHFCNFCLIFLLNFFLILPDKSQ